MRALKSRLVASALGLALLAPAIAQAAHSWVLPSTTILSGGNAWVTFDAATSDELYFPNLRPLLLNTLTVLDSDGQPVEPVNASAGRLRATIDVQLTKPGTYKVASTSTTVLASWTEAGVVKRFRGAGDEFAKQVPADAADLKTIRTVNRNETFVTRDNPTTTVFKTTGQGLELEPITHPSDVIVGEEASFRLILDGKPASGLEVSFMRGGDHWKVRPTEIKRKTGADGLVTVTLPEGGVWLLSAGYRTGENGRGGPPPGGPRPPGSPAPPAQPLAGDGYMANYSATIEAQLP
ncbi:DUF4198 domain-containing protein [Phenylobacterium immobile]|uniref:DUF4198 domain-containing protein n=1 Tax=Phenylobacterium immobile TaxID=21 RepID=UPI000B10DBC8|nr:DUF4198 domain-containing protein [Phenylobacterium immobile]